MLLLQHRPEAEILVARWKGLVTIPELEEGYWAMFTAAQQAKCRFWLIDARLRGDRVGNNQAWFLNVYLPIVTARFAAPLYFAYIIPPSYLYEVEAASITPPLPEMIQRGYRVQPFTEERAAHAWLLGVQELEPKAAPQP